MVTSPLTAFASRHQHFARGLIVLSELWNATIGLVIGSALLADQPGWYLSVLLAGLVLIRFLLTRYITLRLPDLKSRERFWFQKHGYSLLFLINFLAYTIAGGISGRTILHPEPMGSVASERYEFYAGRSEKDTLVSPPPTASPASARNTESRSGTRIAYILLFLASIPTSILSARLACSLACADQGIAAALVILLGFGVLVGGVYFLGRALSKDLKPYRDMTKSERKREGRRFLRALLITVAGLTVAGVILSLIIK
ncbi:hypothetical protein LX87_01706 [Larkinella arboricola]|uniref:Uncharacterized protein n=1 Tax=Larkinella arboricola TaxID=643671 RepID=A0A327X2X6_LARAB|nr:hypothetical protein [Larkinella arboricola]RAK00009.1 hypothetical protein LX87_01706 [Larkinella arboricola]